jgi:replication factor C subunit 1
MDEVDGVGAGDRGGIAALIAVIKQSKTPIICICNDRMNKKLASLVNHCLDLKFMKPTKEQIIKRLRRITFDQNLEIPKATLE